MWPRLNGNLHLRSVTRAAALALLPMPLAALEVGMSWDWQLQSPRDLGVKVDVLDLDPDETTKAELSALKTRGVYTICYVSVGTIEAWRSDVQDFPANIIGHAYLEWEGEAFLDIRAKSVLLPLMTRRFAECKAKGFDAIEPDNLDVHINASGFNIDASDVVSYAKALASIAHGMDLAIGQKNVPDLTSDLVDVMDFAITENCFSDGWCADMAAYPRQGKPVFGAEYEDTPQACAAADRLGLSMIFKSEKLSSGGKACP